MDSKAKNRARLWLRGERSACRRCRRPRSTRPAAGSCRLPRPRTPTRRSFVSRRAAARPAAAASVAAPRPPEPDSAPAAAKLPSPPCSPTPTRTPPLISSHRTPTRRRSTRRCSLRTKRATSSRRRQRGPRLHEVPPLRDALNTVFGEGSPDAQVFFIGEGPGENEDLTGRPFVGRAGAQLDKWIAAMGLKRDAVFIANIVKCRPPNNRVPAPRRGRDVHAVPAAATRDRPAAGDRHARAAVGEVHAPEQPRHGKAWRPLARAWRGIPLMPTYHPARAARLHLRDAGGGMERSENGDGGPRPAGAAQGLVALSGGW